MNLQKKTHSTMYTGILYKKVDIGYDKDNEVLSLESPRWDCNHYIGFGYLTNIGLSTHLDWYLNETTPNKNMFDQMTESFKICHPSLKDESTLWHFCDLFKSWTVLKEAFEIYKQGNSHYTSVQDTNLKDFKIALRILKDLFRVVNKICEILHLEPLEFTESIERDLYKNMNPTTFRKRNPTKTDSRQWTMLYLNKYDSPQNHNDIVIPNRVLKSWLKRSEGLNQ